MMLIPAVPLMSKSPPLPPMMVSLPPPPRTVLPWPRLSSRFEPASPAIMLLPAGLPITSWMLKTPPVPVAGRGIISGITEVGHVAGAVALDGQGTHDRGQDAGVRRSVGGDVEGCAAARSADDGRGDAGRSAVNRQHVARQRAADDRQGA